MGDPTGGILRDTGAESVGYMGDPTGGILRDTGAESVGYTGSRCDKKFQGVGQPLEFLKGTSPNEGLKLRNVGPKTLGFEPC